VQISTKAMSFDPPANIVWNLHAFYGDFGGKLVDRDQIEPKHFQSWIDWAIEKGLINWISTVLVSLMKNLLMVHSFQARI